MSGEGWGSQFHRGCIHAPPSPGPGRLGAGRTTQARAEARLAEVKAGMVEELLQQLAGTGTEGNLVSSLLLASDLLANLTEMRKEVMQKVVDKVGPVLYPSIEATENDSSKLSLRLQKSRERTVAVLVEKLTQDENTEYLPQRYLFNLLCSIKQDIIADTESMTDNIDNTYDVGIEDCGRNIQELTRNVLRQIDLNFRENQQMD